MARRILVTGGAGFVGSNLACAFKRDSENDVVIALDNLKRRGAELALPRLNETGVIFQHGDVRNHEDVAAAGPVDVLVECSAEPSVHAGYDGSPEYLTNTNLLGAINCLEHLRRTGGTMVFLSTSRVYPIEQLKKLPLVESGDRLIIEEGRTGPGWSAEGIAEDFSLSGARSLYGTTKLCAEHVIEEYAHMYGVRSIVNRCGILTGPWQMGKVDQGVVVLWMARHLFGGPLSYMGFGGKGHQVRDMLHVDDLYDLVQRQLSDLDANAGQVFNVGGGLHFSFSLRQLTDFCQQITGRKIDLGAVPETRPADVPYYVTDTRRVQAAARWQPSRDPRSILVDIHQWLLANEALLRPIFAS